MDLIMRKLIRLVFFSDQHATRWSLAFAEFVWAMTLILANDSLSEIPALSAMYHVMPSALGWAGIWLFSAITQFYILVTGSYNERSAVLFASFNSMLWWFCTVSMYLSVTPHMAMSGELALSIAASWIWVRSGWIPLGMRRAPNVDAT